MTFICEATGVPTPTIIWKKDGELVTNDSRHVIDSKSLRILRAMEGDVGVYACVAWNKHAIISAIATLILIG